jgi:hypothetical protein
MPVEKWLPFFEPHFSSPAEAHKFVSACEALPASPPMIMMHQAQRLVSLADDIVQVRKKDSLRLLFLLICAEAIAKLHDGVAEEGGSRRYTRKFFHDYLSTEDKETMEASFVEMAEPDPVHEAGSFNPLSSQKAVDLLYEIRCDVVHEGNYWGFNFSNGTSTITAGPQVNVIVNIRYPDFRDIVTRGAIKAIQSKLPA